MGCSLIGKRASVWFGLAVCACGSVAAQQACAPHIEEQARWGSASFRPHTDVFLECPVAETTYRSVVRQWLRGRGDDAPPIASLALGRAVGFPWISNYIASAALTSPLWDAERGRVRSGGANALVASLLSDPGFLERLQAPFAGSPYTVVGVSVEKVLVGETGGVASGAAPRGQRTPYDAQVWIVLRGSR